MQSELCPFSKLIVEGSTAGLKLPETLFLDQVYEVHPVKKALNSIREWLVTPTVLVPVSHQCACLLKPVTLKLMWLTDGYG